MQSKEDKIPFALLLNDIHASKDNIADFLENWKEAVQVAYERGIKELLVGGDMWQSRASQTLSTLLAVRQAINYAIDLGFYITIGEGNHDKVDQEALLGYSHIFSGYKQVDVVDDWLIIKMEPGDMELAIMSYFPENGSFEEKLKELESIVKNPKRTVLYIHEGINGALSTSSDKELSPSIFKNFYKVLVGHYHDRAVVGKNIEYIGSSRQHNFGEDEDKGYTILYTDGSTEFVKNQVNTRFHTITMDIDDLDNIASEIEPYINDGYKIKLKISAPNDEAVKINKQELIELGISKIEVLADDIAVESKTQNFDVKFDKLGIKKEYKSFCLRKEIEDVELGLSYLDKIN